MTISCSFRFSGDADQCDDDAVKGSQYCIRHKAVIDAVQTFDKWAALKKLVGHWQSGEQETVKLFWDDATHTAHITVGKKSYYGDSFETALNQAVKDRL